MGNVLQGVSYSNLRFTIFQTQDVYYLFVLAVVLASQAYASLSGQAFENMVNIETDRRNINETC